MKCRSLVTLLLPLSSEGGDPQALVHSSQSDERRGSGIVVSAAQITSTGKRLLRRLLGARRSLHRPRGFVVSSATLGGLSSTWTPKDSKFIFPKHQEAIILLHTFEVQEDLIRFTMQAAGFCRKVIQVAHLQQSGVQGGIKVFAVWSVSFRVRPAWTPKVCKRIAFSVVFTYFGGPGIRDWRYWVPGSRF